MIELLLKALWFILPAYIANASPPIISKFKRLQKYNRSIDNKKTINGKRLFGEGKTWFGLIFGIAIGTLAGTLQSIFQIEPKSTILLAFMLSFGALFGDIIGSFTKRKLNIQRGRPVPFLDQLDFLLGAFLFASVVTKINLNYVFILLFITPIIHLTANFVGYKLKINREPW